MEDNAIWQQFLNLTDGGVFDVDFDTQRIRCSDSFARQVRLTPETLPHTLEQWFELYHPDDYDVGRELRRHLFESGSTRFSLEHRLYCGDGQYRPFCLDAFCIRDKEGRIRHMIGVETPGAQTFRTPPPRPAQTAQELRELRKSLASAEDREKRLSSSLSRTEERCESLERQLYLATQMLDATSEPVFHCDEEGRTDLFNSAFSRALAGDPDLAQWVSAVHKGDERLQEYRYRDRCGRDRILETRALSPTNRHGQTMGRIGVASDVTDVREMEAEAMRLRHRMGSLILQNGLLSENSRSYTKKSHTKKSYTKSYIIKEDAEADESGRRLLREGDLTDPAEALQACLTDVIRSLSNAAATSEAGGALTDLLPVRVSQFENLFHASARAELEVGVVGITSSGKSTFINAMMGERLLPEETRATTNLVVRCRRGDERAVVVVMKDGGKRRVSGAELTPAWMEGLASERMNPANEQNIERLEWSSPGAVLPEGLVLIDTPGLDACDFPEHSELVLRRLLPSLDIVLYVTSIRNRFKSSDLELLQAVLEQDQRIIFLLSQIDLEQDDTEGGRVVLSRRRKLSACLRELREDIENISSGHGALGDSAIVPISSKLAMAHFYDRNSPAWDASNFGPLIRHLESFRANLSRYGLEACARRSLVVLSRTASDLGLILGSLSTEQAEAEGTRRLERIRELRDAQRWISAEISAVRNEWRRLLDPESHLGRLEREIQGTHTLGTIKDRYERWGADCATLAARMTARMDRARLSCREMVQKLGVPLHGRAEETPDDLPAPNRCVLPETRQVQIRGWFENLQFWPQHRTFFHQQVDREKMLAGAEELLTERLRLLNGHLTWWENRMREDWCDPLYGELKREEAALADIRRLVTDASVSRSALRYSLSDVREAERGVRNLMPGFSTPDIDAESLFPEDFFDVFDRFDDLPEPKNPVEAESFDEEDESRTIFAPLLAAFHEQHIQSRFLEMNALRGRRRVVLLGLRRHDSLRFLSRLAHDVALVDSLRTEEGLVIDERDWIFCGATPPALPHVQISVPDSQLRELDVLVAPSDGFCSSPDAPSGDWNDLFAEWTPVVHLDVARIDSGLSDIARAPYAAALARVDRWIAASGQGALFAGRLTDLLTDVPDRMDNFIRNRGHRGEVEWFLYENYDARYSDFILWGREILRAPASAEEKNEEKNIVNVEALCVRLRSDEDLRENPSALSRGEAAPATVRVVRGPSDADGLRPPEPERLQAVDSSLLVERWKQEGHDFAPPFSEHRLRRAMDGALHRKRGDLERSGTI
ncbi:MAG: dynamin family protein [Synergistaceae bacterium]|jgi:PAS domain-containing protein/ribosome biogenesis GTPase A|nr:dynamin family protein [Synergistaceae bacterium]